MTTTNREGECNSRARNHRDEEPSPACDYGKEESQDDNNENVNPPTLRPWEEERGDQEWEKKEQRILIC